MEKRKKISIAGTCYNESGNIRELYSRCMAELKKFPDYDYEFVMADNCSTDDTRVKLRELAIRAGNSEFGLNPIIDDIRRMEDEKYSSIVFEEYDEQFMYFLAIALFFFVIEMLVGDRRSKRHLFNR